MNVQNTWQLFEWNVICGLNQYIVRVQYPNRYIQPQTLYFCYAFEKKMLNMFLWDKYRLICIYKNQNSNILLKEYMSYV